MEKLSRVKKYQELRDTMQSDPETKIQTPDLSEFANRLNKIDSEQFDKIDKEDFEHDPIHARRNRYLSENDEKVNDLSETTKFSFDFNNEYLDEYISEVKQYNKSKGLINNEDTSANILENLRMDNVNYKEFVVDKNDENQFDEEMQVKAVDIQQMAEQSLNEFTKFDDEQSLNINSNDILVEDFNNELNDYIETEMANEIDEQANVVKKNKGKKIKADDAASLRKKLVDMGDYDDEDDDKNGSNKLLNSILIILIVALVILLGVVLYWILVNNGVI